MTDNIKPITDDELAVEKIALDGRGWYNQVELSHWIARRLIARIEADSKRIAELESEVERLREIERKYNSGAIMAYIDSEIHPLEDAEEIAWTSYSRVRVIDEPEPNESEPTDE